MSTLSIQLLYRRSIDLPELAVFASSLGAMINLHWLELPMARTIFHGHKGVRAIEVRQYLGWCWGGDFHQFYSREITPLILMQLQIGPNRGPLPHL